MSADLMSTASDLPPTDELAKMFTCSFCLEIFFEPCTTRCGHSFCKTCLQSYVYKSGQRCRICSQWIRKGESYSLNIVLWNTVTYMFPREVEARKKCDALYRPRDFSAQSRGEFSMEFLNECIRPVSVGFRGKFSKESVDQCIRPVAFGLFAISAALVSWNWITLKNR